MTTTNKAITCFLNYYSIVSGSHIIANTSGSKLLDEISLNLLNSWSNGGSTYVHYIMCISVNLIDLLIPMVIICNSPLFQHIQGDLKEICLYSGYEYLMASGGGGGT